MVLFNGHYLEPPAVNLNRHLIHYPEEVHCKARHVNIHRHVVLYLEKVYCEASLVQIDR